MANQPSSHATTVSGIPSGLTRPSALEQARHWHERIGQLLALWQRRSRDRAALRSLSAHAIQDFCPRLTEAEMEMNKPFWRA